MQGGARLVRGCRKLNLGSRLKVPEDSSAAPAQSLRLPRRARGESSGEYKEKGGGKEKPTSADTSNKAYGGREDICNKHIVK